MEQRATGDDAKTVAAKVSETGLSELAGLPSNVSGFARAVVNRTLGHARGSRRLTAARVFAVTGICLTLSSALAVAVYEILLGIE